MRRRREGEIGESGNKDRYDRFGPETIKHTSKVSCWTFSAHAVVIILCGAGHKERVSNDIQYTVYTHSVLSRLRVTSKVPGTVCIH